MDSEREKELAALAALKWIKEGMTVGLGSGSTAAYMIKALGEEVAQGLSVQGVASSDRTGELARLAGIPLIPLEDTHGIDVNIDGADEFDPYMQLIKGGGGALLREKIIADHSKLNIVIADSGKEVKRLGKFRLPIETVPFATRQIYLRLQKQGLDPELRKEAGEVYITDENNYILDCDISQVTNLTELERMLIGTPGIVETGLFLESTDIIILGKGETTEILHR
ncbi:MAG: ribose-5-phosphate isomerase RpiA [Sediminicola sp.]|tara:strand:- start:19962 stop:20636 length:675 start_codon:yes stop_codon:yes gene_type:complete